MKIGCAAGTFTYPSYNAPYDDAIKTIGELGFEGIEMIAFSIDDLYNYYTDKKITEHKKQIDFYGMSVSEFILYAPLLDDLLAHSRQEKQKAYDIFERGLDTAAKFATGIINIVSNWPLELKAPIPYIPSFIHPNVDGVGKFDPKLKMELPPGFDAPFVWENYMQSLEHLVGMCERYKIKFALEGHANVIVGTTDAFLRAADRITSPYFTTNFDTAWQLVQREYLPWSVYKLRDRISHVHLRDGDGLGCYRMPTGTGIIDFHGFVRALKEIGFDGFLSFELAGLSDPVRQVGQAKEYMERVLKAEGIKQ